VSAVSDLIAGNRDVQDESVDFCDFHDRLSLTGRDSNDADSSSR
jgi:hypothetical protein